MSKTASKGALRAAHEKKSKKHSQQTPLPPRPETVKAIAELVAEVAAEATVPTGKLTPEQKAERAKETFDAKQFGTKSGQKAKAFIERIKAHGWTASTVAAGDHIEVTARRGKAELIFIDWTNGVYQNNATYAYGDRTVKLRNASAATKYAERTPETGAEETERVAANKAFKKRDPEAGTIRPVKLPFDLATATEPEMLKALLGRTITWHNRISNSTETASVLANPRQVHFDTVAGETVMRFLCPNTGFRACRLAAITRLSRGQAEYVTRADREEARSPRGRAVKA